MITGSVARPSSSCIKTVQTCCIDLVSSNSRLETITIAHGMQAINMDKLYSTEDGEPQQADDPEETISESQLAHALQFDEYAIARVLALCQFHPKVPSRLIRLPHLPWDHYSL